MIEAQSSTSSNQLSFLKHKEKKNHPDRQTSTDNTVWYCPYNQFYQILLCISTPIWTRHYCSHSLHQQYHAVKTLIHGCICVTGRLKSHSDDITASCLNPVRTCSRTRVPSCQWGQHNPDLFQKDKINQSAENDKGQLSQSAFSTILAKTTQT